MKKKETNNERLENNMQRKTRLVYHITNYNVLNRFTSGNDVVVRIGVVLSSR